MAVAIIVFGVAVTGTQSAQAQTYNVLYSFTGGADGAYPYAPLVLDETGNLYGTTEYGGTYQQGAVFKLDSSGTETVLHSFKVSGTGDGQYPFAGLMLDEAGNLYGTTQFGGTFGKGTVFKVDTSGKETVLYSFTGGADGANPRAGLVQDGRGNLYSTTYNGGSGSCVVGCGIVFKLDVIRNEEKVLYTFTGGADGSNPSGVILDKAGNLYGTTLNYGSSGYGTVFKLSKSGKETVLYSFTGGTDGSYPYADLVLDERGNLYGTTQGGIGGNVFKLGRSGKLTVLHSFTGSGDGAQPFAGLALDEAGNLYGTTYWGGVSNAGTIFKVDANGGESVLHSFTGGTDGAFPYAGLVQDAVGNLFGTTIYGGGASPGGASGFGTVFKLTP
ncbi:MAG: hypothetical protein LAN61_00440 [Acidobacteriia bacterium]|nr:hypothetical protein [Terriglobia bacterium]